MRSESAIYQAISPHKLMHDAAARGRPSDRTREETIPEC